MQSLAEAPAHATSSARSGQRKAASLGIYAKIDPAPAQQGFAGTYDPETGEILTPPDSIKQRALRWALKSVVNGLLPTSRTSKCMRWRVPGQVVQVCKDVERGKAFYNGLQVCASVWSCPVCASKISERRRIEMAAATAVAKAKGLRVWLMTLTVPHGLSDPLAVTMERLTRAMRYFGTGRPAATWRKGIGLVGTVRALEVTHGANGWHPHFHVLMFLDHDIDPVEARNAGSLLWQKAAVRAGLPAPHLVHGFDLQDGSWAQRYVTKWGLESEMTKGHLKAARGRNGTSVWGLLAKVLEEDDDQAKALFVEFSQVFKGQRQLWWSHGLKALLAVEEKTDEEVANEVIEEAVVFARLTDDQWKALYRQNLEAMMLTIAEHAPNDFWTWVDTAVASVKTCQRRRKR